MPGVLKAKSTLVTVTLGGLRTRTVFGHPVTLTATISAATASGKVTFFDGTTILGIGSWRMGRPCWPPALAGVRKAVAEGLLSAIPTLRVKRLAVRLQVGVGAASRQRLHAGNQLFRPVHCSAVHRHGRFQWRWPS